MVNDDWLLSDQSWTTYRYGVNSKMTGSLLFERARARIELWKNFDTSKLQVINNFVISTLIMGSNSYSEVYFKLRSLTCLLAAFVV